MKKQIPLVSVILPVYNAERTVRDSILSILSQTYHNIELLIINDGSTDNSDLIVKSFSDSRINYVINDHNIGLIETLNKGLYLSKGEYIARMDADDISYNNRIKLQVKMMTDNQDIVVCSASRLEVNEVGKKHRTILPLTDNDIRISIIFNSPFTHPAIMLRGSIVKQNRLKFDARYKYAEDYAFWIQMLKYGKGANLSRILLQYNITEGSQTSIGESDTEKRYSTITKIQEEALSYFNIKFEDDKDVNFLFILSLSDRIRKINFEEYEISYIKFFFRNLKSQLILSKKVSRFSINIVLSKVYLKVLFFNFNKIPSKKYFKLFFSQMFLYGCLSVVKDRINVR